MSEAFQAVMDFGFEQVGITSLSVSLLSRCVLSQKQKKGWLPFASNTNNNCTVIPFRCAVNRKVDPTTHNTASIRLALSSGFKWTHTERSQARPQECYTLTREAWLERRRKKNEKELMLRSSAALARGMGEADDETKQGSAMGLMKEETNDLNAGKIMCRWCMNLNVEKTFGCSHCDWARYCSKGCQKADWKFEHRKLKK